ncbi:MAG: DegT/DnrJ/EryC1/StrS family aminotransferase [Spirochaetota bacterium]
MIKFNKPTIEKKDLESVLYCMIGDDLRPGEYLKSFSKIISRSVGAPNVAVFNTYFNGFEVIFNLIGASRGDQVIMPSFARYKLLKACIRSGLEVVLVDVAEDSLAPSVEEVRKNIGPQTCCIILPQMFGIPHDISGFMGLGVPVIEELDGAIGSKLNGKTMGSFGTYTTMSFNDYSIITTGSGGMAASSNNKLKQMLKDLKDDHYHLDYMMSDFNASLGISQITRLGQIVEKRRSIAEYYDAAVNHSSCSLVGRGEDKQLCFSSYVVDTSTPFEECRRFFKKYGIPVKRGIETPLHRCLGLPAARFRNTEEMFSRILALPIYPTLSGSDVEKVVKGIKSIL